MSKWIMLASVLFCTSCSTDVDEAQRALTNQGFQNIQVGDTDWFSCGEGDKSGRSFTATNSNGLKVSGVVCCGWTKGCTIRW